MSASPSRSHLAVRPHRWTKELAAWGGSNWITISTLSMSIPRDKMSVQSKIPLE